MEAAAPAAAEAAGHEELGGCWARAGALADVAQGCASAGSAEAPSPRSASAGSLGAVRAPARPPTLPHASGFAFPVPRQGETRSGFPVVVGVSWGSGFLGLWVWRRFERKTIKADLTGTFGLSRGLGGD